MAQDLRQLSRAELTRSTGAVAEAGQADDLVARHSLDPDSGRAKLALPDYRRARGRGQESSAEQARPRSTSPASLVNSRTSPQLWISIILRGSALGTPHLYRVGVL